jgi:hypothetical protein
MDLQEKASQKITALHAKVAQVFTLWGIVVTGIIMIFRAFTLYRK